MKSVESVKQGLPLCSILRPWRVLAAQAGPRARFFTLPALFTRERASCSLRPWREKVSEGQMRGYQIGKHYRQPLTWHYVPSSPARGEVNGTREKGELMRGYSSGFTLMEMLVVVLIIGILGAIMLPQYQRAVLKSRFAALMPIAKSMADSNEAYYLEHGEYAGNAEDLPIQGRMNYSDGTELEFGTTSEYSYVLATRDNDFPNKYIVYQKHSEQFPGEIHCEAAADNTLAQDVCKSFGATEDIGETLTSGYLTYVLSGTGNGHAPIPCPDGATCDENGNVTECASGLTLNNGECVTCDIPNATSCSTTSYAPTACSDGYIVNGTACEPDPTVAQLQAVAASKCPANQTDYVCTIKNGAVYRCDTESGTINAQGECVSKGTNWGNYETVYNPDGIKKQESQCASVDSGRCWSESFMDYAAGTGKWRQCADKAAISKDLTCANGYAQSGYDYTLNSHGQPTDANSCSAVNGQGVCTAYSLMYHYDNRYDANGNYTGRTEHTCTSIDPQNPTECLTWNPPL